MGVRVLTIEDSAQEAERIEVELLRAGLELEEVRRVRDAAALKSALEWPTGAAQTKNGRAVARPLADPASLAGISSPPSPHGARAANGSGPIKKSPRPSDWDLLISTCELDGFGLLDVLNLLRRRDAPPPLLVVSEPVGEVAVAEFMRAGACDVVLKHDLSRLGPAAARAIAVSRRRRQAHAARREALRLAAIVRTSDDAIASTDLDGFIVTWNPAARRLYGWTEQEAVGRQMSLLTPADRRGELAAALADVRAGKPVKLQETERVAKDGRRIQVSVAISPLFAEDGTLIGASSIARDITQAKISEHRRQRQSESLRKSEQWYRRLLDSMPHMVWMADADGRWDYLNPRGHASLGIEAPVADWLDLVHPDDVVPCRRVWREAIRAGRFSHECRLHHADGSFRWVLAQGERLDRAGEPPCWIGTLTGIDELKRAEAAIQRDALLLANVRDAVIVTDLDGIVTYWNDAATRLFGWTPAELLGRPLVERVPEHARAAMAELIGQIAAGSSLAGDYQDWHRDGTPVWIDARVFRIHDPQGRPVGIMGLSHGIGDRKRAEAERDRLLDQLRLQIERMPLGYIFFDADDRIADWNPAAEAIFGYTRAEMLGHGPPFEKFVPPDAWPLVQRTFAQARSGDVQPSRALPNLTRDRRRIVCDWRSVPLTAPGGGYIGMFSLAQDVTERRRAEETLRLLERAIQAATQGILITDISNRDHPHIIYASPGLLHLTGYAEEDLIGRRAAMLCGPGADPIADPDVMRAIREGRPATVEMFTYRKDGSGFWDEISLSPILDADGRLTHFVGVHTDITRRRELERQYLHAQKMEAIGRLAGGIAHDFNNLLTVINGYAEMLVTRSQPADPNWKALNQIKAAGERSAALTRQLLTFSRQEMVRPAVLDLNAAIRDIEPMLKPLLGEEVKLNCSLMPGPAMIKADGGHIEQVVMNLAVNARDAMPRGGSLSLTTAARTAAPAGGAPGQCIELTMRDTGCGMSPEVQARIFEPFFTTKGKRSGTGLGLSVVDGILKQSGGFVEVESEPGKGSAFHLFWPLAHPGEAAAPAPAPLPDATGDETVLLVEDDDDARGLTRLVLEEAGFQVLVANGGEPALRLAREHPGPIHLLLTDVVMPGMGGREVSERLLLTRPECKVLFISGYTDDAVVRHGVQHDQFNFLPKPFSPAALAEKVRQVLDAGRVSKAVPSAPPA